jgi:hypothetical protein
MFQIVRVTLNDNGEVDARRPLQPLFELREDAMAMAEFDASRLWVKDGVCGVLIAEKLGVSQPTVGCGRRRGRSGWSLPTSYDQFAEIHVCPAPNLRQVRDMAISACPGTC